MRFDGQPQATAYLSHAWRSGRLAASYAFVGPPGIGKRKAALEFAAALLCAEQPFAACGQCSSCRRVKAGIHPDVRIYEPEDGKRIFSTKIVDAIMDDLSLMPVEGKKRIAIVDKADQMRAEAANKFLKTLEEPPDTALIVLLASEWHALLETIRSRVHAIRFVPIQAEMMRRVAEAELSAVSDDALRKLAPLAQGAPAKVAELAAEGFEPVRDFLLQIAIEKPIVDPVEAAEALISLTKRPTETNQDPQRQRLRAALGQVALWWRDALVYHRLHAGEAVDPLALAALKRRLDGVNTTALIEQIDRLLDMTGDLALNMNLQLWSLRFLDLAPHPLRS